MSKRNHIVERASDVNGGQYIQTNPSYNSGYEDGKKAGKEYCASVIESLREQVEKLTKEREELVNAIDNEMVVTHLGVFHAGDDPKVALNKICCYAQDLGKFFAEDACKEQLAALAEQNEKMRSFLEFAWKDIPMNEYAFKILEHVMNLPNLATPALNRIKAEGMRDAAMHCSKHGSRIADEVSEDLFANADELEQSK